MSEPDNFLAIVKGSKSDAAVLITTFLLTVLVDLTVAIEIGMVLAAFLFMRKIMQSSSVKQLAFAREDTREDGFADYHLPKGVVVFEINGPLFFGAAYKFRDAMSIIEKPASVLIIRMKNVPVIDATGLKILKEVNSDIKRKGTKLILSEVNSEQVLAELKKSRLHFYIGKANITNNFDNALKRADQILKEKQMTVEAGRGASHSVT